MHYFLELKTALFAQFTTQTPITQLTKGLSRVAEKVLQVAWEKSGLQALPNEQLPTLLAVGGFGRNELFPYSDIDIVLLLPKPLITDATITPAIEKFISLCWDLGLEIGSAVRCIEECLAESKKDITVRTSLLESRYVLGNKKLFNAFQRQFLDDLDPQAFFLEKLLELRQRHQKYQNTPYSLEPNIKESPGGLRDIQVILWVTRAANLGNTFKDLHNNGIITAREALELAKNHRLLQRLRAQMHLLSRRRQDQLVFEIQDPLAAKFNLHSTSKKRASEQIMRRYYWAAKAVTQLNEILIQNIEALLFPKEAHIVRPLAKHFVERQGQLDIIDPQLFSKNPEFILTTFVVFANTSGLTGLSTQILRGIYNARARMDAQWRKNPKNRQQFMAIIQSPTGVFRSLNAMNQTSVLGRYLPPFRKIVGQMQHDLFHVYTVDQHILTVLKNVRRFFVPEIAHEFPFCSELAANFDKPWVILLGALFHDIAKGRGGDHSQLGRQDVKVFAAQHGLSKADSAMIAFLVAEHLSMSQIAQKMDISDPAVIDLFAKKVGDEKHLTALYLLTVADIRGTSPKVWNAWKGKLLEDLYRLTLNHFGGAKFDTSSQLESRQQDALVRLRFHGLAEDAHMALWKKCDVGFFLKHDADSIAWITRHLYKVVDAPRPIVQARLSAIGEGLQIVVYVQDQSDLFARICAYFDQRGFSIQEAIIHTTKHGYALDTFQVSYSQEINISEYRPVIQMVEYELAEMTAQSTPLPAAHKGRISRQSKSFPMQPRVHLSPDEKGELFILSLSANDRVGLLYSVSKILAHHQISLKNAKIHTLGERVEDTLLLDGEKLKLNPKLQIQIETELIEALAD